MGGQTSGQKQSAQYTGQGVQSINDIFGVQQNSDPYQLLQSLSVSLAQHPDVLSPELLAGIKRNALDSQQLAYEGNVNDTAAKYGSIGQLRGGGFQDYLRGSAATLANNSADASRSLDVQAAQLNRASAQAALSGVQSAEQMREQPYRDRANILAGASANPVWSQASPLTSFGQGLGQLGGAAFGTKGIFK